MNAGSDLRQLPAPAQSGALRVRPMAPGDLPAVLAIQARCYDADKHEPAAAFEAKLRGAPRCSFVAVRAGTLAGYLVALPAHAAHPPALHSTAWTPPPVPDCLYLHDMAVAPHARGSGVADALLAAFFGQLRALGLRRASLTAVQGASAYWARHGFRPQPPSERLASYGPGACAMWLDWPE